MVPGKSRKSPEFLSLGDEFFRFSSSNDVISFWCLIRKLRSFCLDSFAF